MRRFRSTTFALSLALCAPLASAQIGGTLAGSLAAPDLADFKLTELKPLGKLLTGPDGTTVALTTRGTAPATVYLERAAVTLPSTDGQKAGTLLSALTGEDFTQDLADYLKQPEVKLRLATGLKVQADGYDLGLKSAGQGLTMTVALHQNSGFAPVPANRVLGNPAAPYAVRMYSDFQCPYCQKAELEAMPAVMKALPGDVRFEFHHLPLEQLHPNARAAAEASVCAASQGKFFAFKDALFHRNDWQKAANPTAVFQQVAQGAGVTLAKYRSCVADRAGKAEVDAGLAEAQRIGVRGTPTVYIGGYQVADPYDAASYRALLDFVRAK